MTIRAFRNGMQQMLGQLYPSAEIESMFFMLMEFYLGKKRVDVVLNLDESIAKPFIIQLNEAINLLSQEKPIQHILGETEFYGYRFFVNEYTLIPRPETEELVSWILETIAMNQNLKLKSTLECLDIGTGSGCIPITLSKETDKMNFDAIDISNEALQVASKNATINEVNINWLQNDILSIEKIEKSYDIIISNPPYVRELEKEQMKNNVLHNEPHDALFVPNNDPLLFYRKIGELALKSLSKNGILFFEINQYLGKEMVDLMQELGYHHIELKKDFMGNDRMIKASI